MTNATMTRDELRTAILSVAKELGRKDVTPHTLKGMSREALQSMYNMLCEMNLPKPKASASTAADGIIEDEVLNDNLIHVVTWIGKGKKWGKGLNCYGSVYYGRLITAVRKAGYDMVWSDERWVDADGKDLYWMIEVLPTDKQPVVTAEAVQEILNSFDHDVKVAGDRKRERAKAWYAKHPEAKRA